VRQYFIYPIQLVGTLLFERLTRRQADVCVVSTNTFYAPLLATCLHRNVVHLVYDLFPEAMIHSGKWRAGSLKARLVHWITCHTLRRARQNVFLGQRLRNYVESLYGPLENATVIEVGADQMLFGGSDSQKVGEHLKMESTDKSTIEILYCGNFGNLHDSATLFQYWNKVAESLKFEGGSLKGRDPGLRWTFHCSGPKRAELVAVRESLPDSLKDSIQVRGGLGQTEWVAAMRAANIALVTMAPGSETVVMPSKTYSAMMAGQAVLAIAPEASDLVDTIKKANSGWWTEPGNVSGLERMLEAINSNPEEVLEKRVRAYQYAHEHFGQDALAKKWQVLFESIILENVVEPTNRHE
jgi:glycosyltransferase involved in cell wall biosynthesis